MPPATLPADLRGSYEIKSTPGSPAPPSPPPRLNHFKGSCRSTVRGRWVLINTLYIKHEGNVPPECAGWKGRTSTPGLWSHLSNEKCSRPRLPQRGWKVGSRGEMYYTCYMRDSGCVLKVLFEHLHVQIGFRRARFCHGGVYSRAEWSSTPLIETRTGKMSSLGLGWLMMRQLWQASGKQPI